MIRSLLALSFFMIFSLAAETANAQRYRVACAGNQGYTVDDPFSGIHQGLVCQNPHGLAGACTSSNVGSAQGTAQCMVQDQNDMTGTNGANHGTFQTENCVCVDCETDPFQQGMLSSSYPPDMNDYACQGYTPAVDCVSAVSAAMACWDAAGDATAPCPSCGGGPFDLPAACCPFDPCSQPSPPAFCASVTPPPSGTQTRVVECRDSLGFTIPPSFCTGPPPPDTQVCGAPPTTPPVTSPAPAPPNCEIHYQFRNDEVSTPIGSGGSWVQFINNADRDCDEMPGCGIRIGVSCAPGSTDEVRVAYEFEWISQVGPNANQQTPWSGTTGSVQWGPWAYYYQNGHTNEECRLGFGRRCGISMTASLRAGGTCDVDYQIRAEEHMSPLESNGVKSYLPNMGNRNENCDDSPGCGIRATLDCSGGGGGGGGGAGTWTVLTGAPPIPTCTVPGNTIDNNSCNFPPFNSSGWCNGILGGPSPPTSLACPTLGERCHAGYNNGCPGGFCISTTTVYECQ